jgi:hypothetical protein
MCPLCVTSSLAVTLTATTAVGATALAVAARVVKSLRSSRTTRGEK